MTKEEIDEMLMGFGIVFFPDEVLLSGYLKKRDFEELITEVWNKAIQAAADNAECDCDIPYQIEYEFAENVECALNRGSILKLKM
jgi:hypothetical protein